MLDLKTKKHFDSFCFLSQVLPVSAAERWCGFRPSALLLCYPHSSGLLHSAVWTGRLWPRGTGQWLHQRTALRTQPDQRIRGEGHGAPQDLQVSLSIISFRPSFNCSGADSNLQSIYKYCLLWEKMNNRSQKIKKANNKDLTNRTVTYRSWDGKVRDIYLMKKTQFSINRISDITLDLVAHSIKLIEKMIIQSL